MHCHISHIHDTQLFFAHVCVVDVGCRRRVVTRVCVRLVTARIALTHTLQSARINSTPASLTANTNITLITLSTPASASPRSPSSTASRDSPLATLDIHQHAPSATSSPSQRDDSSSSSLSSSSSVARAAYSKLSFKLPANCPATSTLSLGHTYAATHNIDKEATASLTLRTCVAQPATVNNNTNDDSEEEIDELEPLDRMEQQSVHTHTPRSHPHHRAAVLMFAHMGC